MALNSTSEYFRFLSNSSAKLARKLGNFKGTGKEFAAIAVSYIYGGAKQLLLEILEQAIQQSGEYTEPILAAKLIEVFSKDGIISFSEEGVRINAMEIAGNWGDLNMGIDLARMELAEKGNYKGILSPAEAAIFWAERIYKPAREGSGGAFFKKKEGFDYATYGIIRYKETLEARLRNWKDLAPYWLWLEFGNAVGGRGGQPYPSVAPTHFAQKAGIRINALYQETMIRVTEELIGTLSQDVENFLINPESYQPSHKFDDYISRAGRFRVFVTEAGQLGIRKGR